MTTDALLQDGNNHAIVEETHALCRDTVVIGWGNAKSNGRPGSCLQDQQSRQSRVVSDTDLKDFATQFSPLQLPFTSQLHKGQGWASVVPMPKGVGKQLVATAGAWLSETLHSCLGRNSGHTPFTP